MKCVVCGHRKGKRSCPAKAGAICAQCCGEKRITEIPCPESCAYLQTGREHEIAQGRQIVNSGKDSIALEKRHRVVRENERVVSILEYTVAEQRRTSRRLGDREALEAVTLLVETLRTEDRGIIYDRTSTDPEVESLRRQLASAVQTMRYPKDDAPPVRLGAAIDSLEYVRDTIYSFVHDPAGKRSYVDFIYRLLGRSAPPQDPGSSLIVPGR